MSAQYVTAPPDGGWGWIVVISSFIIHFCIDGITYAFGVLATEFVENLNCSRQMNGWIASIMVGITLGGGPIASVMSEKFGHRCVTMLGSIIACIGFVASAFITEAWMLTITAGVIVGFGMSLIYLSAIVCVGIYFDRRRSTAIGIAVCGSGCGTFVFSPLISMLIEAYTWRGALLLLGGIVLQCVVCGALFRPLMLHAVQGSGHLLESADERADKVKLRLDSQSAAHNFLSAPEISSGNTNGGAASLPVRANSIEFYPAADQSAISLTHVDYPAHYIRSIASLAGTAGDESTAGNKSLGAALRSELASMLNLSLMRDVAFIIFLVSNLLCSIGFNAPFLYTPDRAQRAGISRTNSSLLVSIIGIANMIGRVFFGFLSDRRFVNKLQLYNFSVVIAGLVLIFSFLSNTYAFMAIYCALFGVFIGTYVTLTSPVLVDLLGVQNLGSSFGMTLLFQGIGVFVGPPIAGFIFDETNSFDIPFVVCGTCVFISGLMLIPLPVFRRIFPFDLPSATINVKK